MVKLFYTTYISVDLAHQVIFCAKVGKGGIIFCVCYEIYTRELHSLIYIQ